MKLRLGSMLPLVCLLLAGPALAEEGLRDKAKGLFEPIPQTARRSAGRPGDGGEDRARQDAVFRSSVSPRTRI